MNWKATSAVLFTGLGLIFPACAGSEEDILGDGTGKGGGPGTTGGRTGGGGRGTGIDVGGANNGGAGTDKECGEGVPSEPPVLEFVVDTSGSMNCLPGESGGCDPGAGSKWELTRDALKSAVERMGDKTGIGVVTYPQGNRCAVNQNVAIDQIGPTGSPMRTRFTAWATAVTPTGSTPTHSGLRYGIQQLENFTQLKGFKFVVLITDGEPTQDISCQSIDSTDPTAVQPIIQEAADGKTKGIRTFVIGSPGSELAREPLSKIAEAGGTAKPACTHMGPDYCHFDLTTEKDLATALNKALDEVTRIAGCEIPIPKPPAGKQLDLNKINVIWVRPGGETPLFKVATCGDGWQLSPDGKSVLLCPATCDAIKADKGATVKVTFGCATITR